MSIPITLRELQVQVLPDSGLFIEETNYSQHLYFTKDEFVWSRVDDFNSCRIGSLSWSPYLTTEDASILLKEEAKKLSE